MSGSAPPLDFNEFGYFMKNKKNKFIDFIPQIKLESFTSKSSILKWCS